MDELITAAILKEKEKRKNSSSLSTKILSSLFEKQLNFINDPSDRKVVYCTRRAGKTRAACAYLLKVALENPYGICIYIALTRARAKTLIMPTLMRLNAEYNIGITPNLADLTFSLANRAVIRLVGANDEVACENLRGDPYHLVILDETQSMRKRHLPYLIDQILTPSLMDTWGTLCMLGTPNSVHTGPFYEACHSTGEFKGYSIHDWGWWDNPYLIKPKEWLEREKKRKGVTDSNPRFQQEYMGKWVKADDFFVYRYTNENLRPIPEDKEFTYIIGIDLGYDDSTAFSVVGFTDDSPIAYQISTFKRPKMLLSEVMELAKTYYDTYHPISISVDSGGLGKALVEELKIRYNLPVKAAEKHKKYEFIQLLNSDLHEKKFIINENSIDLIDEWSSLQYDETKMVIPEGQEDHLSDATLYAWREARHFTFDKYNEGDNILYSEEDKLLDKLIQEQNFNEWDDLGNEQWI